MRPLGEVQTHVLQCLKEHGSWSVMAGWVWNTQSNTKRILDSLVKRGLVTKKTEWSGHDMSRGTTVYLPTTQKAGEDNDN